MLSKIILALTIGLVMAAIMPGINTFMTDATGNLVENLPGVTSFEIAYWQMVPIIMAIWFVFIVPLYIVFHKRSREKKTEWHGGPLDD